MILPPACLLASHTSTDRPPRASHQAEASPEMPPPIISTSTLSIAVLFVRLELRLHFFEQILPQQIARILSRRNETPDGVEAFIGFRIILEARHAIARDLIGIEAQFLHPEPLHALHRAHHGIVAIARQVAGSDAR